MAVIGGANSAGQAAVFLSRQASGVLLVVRGDGLEASMSHYLIEQVAAIDEHRGALAARRSPAPRARTGSRRCRLAGPDGEELVELAAVFVFIGAVPYMDWVGEWVRRDELGFVLAGPGRGGGGAAPLAARARPVPARDDAAGVFVAGDVRHRSIKRVASAVGEGSMSVQFIDEYLAGQ